MCFRFVEKMSSRDLTQVCCVFRRDSNTLQGVACSHQLTREMYFKRIHHSRGRFSQWVQKKWFFPTSFRLCATDGSEIIFTCLREFCVVDGTYHSFTSFRYCGKKNVGMFTGLREGDEDLGNFYWLPSCGSTGVRIGTLLSLSFFR